MELEIDSVVVSVSETCDDASKCVKPNECETNGDQIKGDQPRC